ncbi:metalloregulator ArsR/SmtB family transcription factor [Rapidithrix thailandica]|uniref:Metalloregulator ArsR/SmtB family transcription factor n=1 Tax=Rapidithrix thailandica TaxID=413964 RepID=A0AAW9SK26_9BACT
MKARRDVFQAIADPTRREIMGLLVHNTLTLNGIVEHFEVSRPAISKHIKILEECGLVMIEQQGRERYCTAKPQKLKEVFDWIDQYKVFWNQKLDALDDFLMNDTPTDS